MADQGPEGGRCCLPLLGRPALTASISSVNSPGQAVAALFARPTAASVPPPGRPGPVIVINQPEILRQPAEQVRPRAGWRDGPRRWWRPHAQGAPGSVVPVVSPRFCASRRNIAMQPTIMTQYRKIAEAAGRWLKCALDLYHHESAWSATGPRTLIEHQISLDLTGSGEFASSHGRAAHMLLTQVKRYTLPVGCPRVIPFQDRRHYLLYRVAVREGTSRS